MEEIFPQAPGYNQMTQKKNNLVWKIVAGLSLLFLGFIAFLTSQGRGPLSGFFTESPTTASSTKPKKSASLFVPMPELLVNLNSPPGRQNFLKLSFLLEVEDAAQMDEIKELLPRIVDQFQIYLRQLRVSDLKGSEGIFRLKEQLLARVNAEAAPLKVKDLLFKNMLVQ